jgi:hypothetical protein
LDYLHHLLKQLVSNLNKAKINNNKKQTLLINNSNSNNLKRQFHLLLEGKYHHPLLAVNDLK